eukprot:jgi/Astpho2/7222/fgenesh1_pm.00113_%23_10_t
MARLRTAACDSEDESESSVEETSSEDGSGSSSSSSDAGGAKGPSRFMIGSSDSDDEDEKRVAKSAKDRRFEELQTTCDEIRNKIKINDWSAIQTLFDKLNKQLEKTQKVTMSLGVPRKYVRILVELEDSLATTLADKEAKKKMSPTNARALNAMRQRLKKHNINYQEQIKAFRDNPESTAEEPSDASESDSFDSDGSDEGEQGEGEEDNEGFEKIRSKTEKKKDKILSMDPTQISYDMVTKKLKEIVMARGKKGVDRNEQVDMLTYLATVAKGPVQKMDVLIQVVSALFDINPSMSTHMAVPLWKRCVGTLLEVLQLLQDEHWIQVDEFYEPPAEDRLEDPPAGQPAKVWGNLVGFLERLDDEHFKSLQVIDPHTNAYLERMKDEPLFLALAQKVTDYLERQNDERNQAKVALRRVEHFYYKTDVVYGAMRKLALEQQAETAQLNAAVQQSGDKEDEDPDLDEDEADAKQADKIVVRMPADFVMAESLPGLMAELTSFIYKHGDERTKARAMLCSIYLEAIHDNFHKARDSLLMSHLQDAVQHMDISTQILYNRTMAQVGLCAFRAGLIPEAQAALSELYGTGRVKELLAQGMSMSRYQDKTPEQEKLERRRQVPFHMHINLELLESAHLIAAALLEVPNLAAASLVGQEGTARRRVISKPFRRLLDNYERQTFTGPPENVRDHVMAATKSLMSGQWGQAYEYLAALTVWPLIGGVRKDDVLAMLRTKLQESALKTYLFTYGNYYSSLSLEQLSTMFDMPQKKVHSLVSRLMMEEDLQGSWDQPTATIVMHNAQPRRLQSLALQFAEKAATMVDLNERALVMRTGGMRDTEDEGRGGNYGEGNFGSRRGGRGGRSGLPPGMGRGGRGGDRGGRGGGGGGYDNRGYGGRDSHMARYDRSDR